MSDRPNGQAAELDAWVDGLRCRGNPDAGSMPSDADSIQGPEE